MPFLRLAVIFAFFAFSSALAQLADFAVLANGVSKGTSSTILVETVFGDNLTLSVSPTNGTFEWLASHTIINTGSSYSPHFSENPLTSILETYQIIRKEDGLAKTILITILSRPSYIVSFNTDGGTPAIILPQSVLKDSLAKRPTETLTKTGYDFDGWNFDFSTPITRDTTINAKWKIKTYTVSFNSGGGSTVPSQNVNHNSTASIPTPPPTRTGYDFEGWDFDFSTPITGNITINAKWKIKIYTVLFNSNGGSPVASQSVNFGSTASIPTSPTRPSYDFDGWDFDFSTLITKDTTINAKWKIKTYTVSFNSGGGSIVPKQIVNHNSTASIPTPPTKPGYDFDGWDFDFSTPITKDTTVNAKGWTIITYNITYIPNGGIPVPPPTSYNVNSQPITMPTFDERCGYKFEGWFDNSGFSGTATTSIPTGSTGDKTFHAKWTNTPSTPTKDMLSYSPPIASKIYDGSPIAPITASSTSACPMGAITTLYNDASIEPKNAGTYQIYASIEANESYTAAKILLGSLTISKASATFNVSATVSDKEYDATTAATIKSIDFTPISTLYGTDKLTASDYSASANFDNPNAGTHNINLNVAWLNGPLSQNYNLAIGTISPISAAITKAASTILGIEAKDYELSDPDPHKITISKSSYISDSDVRIEYKREEDAAYISMPRPNRVGNWSVRATVDGNANYEGKTAETSFVVTRGSATTVIHSIEFADSGFDPDPALSGKQRSYYVAGTSLCKIKNTKMQIMVKEPDIILRIKNIPQRGELDENDFVQYEIPFAFGKPGLDTLIYELLSKDNKYSEFDTILIETPIPFETIVGQKWNNVLFVNNNKQTNGGYEFADFKWFKNNDEIGDLQFYSAGPSSTDTLNPNDIYKIVMQTEKGIRISTCEGKAKIKTPTQTPKSALTKQVLGIRESPLNSGSKVYNLNGKLTKETSAGVYIVEE